MKVSVIGPEQPRTQYERDQAKPGQLFGMSEDEFAKLTSSILITVLHRPSEGVTAGLMQATGFWSRFATNVGAVEDPFGGFIEQTRAGMAKLFLQFCHEHPEVKYHVMIDNDEAPEWDAPYRLAAWDLPVVSGVVCTYNQRRGIFACFTVKDEFGEARFPSFNFTRKLPARGLIEANSVGTGLLCVRKDVYEAIYAAGEVPFQIPEASRAESFDTGELKVGEDIAFSRQCERLGYKRHVDLSVHAKHYKNICIQWPQSAIDYDLDARDWKVDSRDRGFGDA